MPDVSTDIVAFLRSDFGAEAAAGFPRLRRIPQTKVIQFIDYFDSLGPGDRSALLDALALRGSVMINPSPAAQYPPAPSFDRYWKAVTSPGPFTGGYRYCDIKSLAAIPKIPEFGSYEAWIEKCQRPGVSERALQPREDLLPNMDCLAPAKAPALRKLVRAALQGRGFAAEVTKGAAHKYVNSSGATVRVDFGSYMGQICYSVSAACAATRIVMLSYEILWSQPGGWDYLSEENAARSVDFLPEFVEYLIQLPERINARTKTGS
jgi:hypothetical protein